MTAALLAVALAAAALGALAQVGWVGVGLFYLRRLRPAAVRRAGRVTLVLPLAGAPRDLPALFAALAAQTLRPARLLVAVEEGDAAAEAAARAATLPFPVEVVHGPPAPHRAQKCSNQLAALARLGPADGVVVLLDADIRPQPWWLSTLASPALDGTADLVTGYRWLRPGPAPLAQLVAFADRGIAVLPRYTWMDTAWGGSIAIGPAALASGVATEALDRTISDDLSLARAARRRGLRVLVRRVLLVPTPLDDHGVGPLRFLVRQFRIIHVFLPRHWWLGAAASHASLALWAVLAWHAPAALLLPAAAGAARWAVHDRVGRRIGAPDGPATRAAQLVLAASPLPDLLAAAVQWASLFPARIAWRHVTYRVTGRDAVEVVRRAPP